MTGCLATSRGWRAQDRIERAALEQMRAFGPQTGGNPVYLGFPWSALIDGLSDPATGLKTADLKTAVLRTALHALSAQIAPGAAVLTVCQHPDLRAQSALLVQAGVTEVFWTHASPGDLEINAVPGLRIHPFPALPDDGPAPAGEGPDAAFAFCPGDRGGNTPRLWGAVAAGLVPVIPLARAALPGLPALWHAGAVFHDALPGDQAALDRRLATIAGDPGGLAAMRAALGQLDLLYGAGRSIQKAGHSVHGVVLRMIDLASGTAPLRNIGTGPGRIVRHLGRADRLTPDDARHVLRAAAGDLLLEGDGAWLEEAGVRRGLEAAHGRLSPHAACRVQFDAVLAHVRAQSPVQSAPARLAAPRRAFARAPAIFFLGPRGQRTPLSYEPLRRQAGARMRRVERPDEADLILTGWNRDLEDNRDLLRDTLAARPATKIAVISEEPLWDSLWSGGFAARDRSLVAGDVEIPYRFLNHVNSGIFDFRRIPYFLLTSDTFAARYSTLIPGFSGLGARALLAHWRAAPLQCAFFHERRDIPEYAARFPEQGLYGLSVHRSRIAALIPDDRVLRVGQGWAGTPQRRQDLPDWHLDKLARLHGRLRVCAAHENTLFRDYLTEKPFDAFAIGAVPAVVAGSDHRLFDLIAPDAVLDTAGFGPDLAAARIAAFSPDMVTAEAWIDSAVRLVALLRDTEALIAERRRVVDATLNEIAALL